MMPFFVFSATDGHGTYSPVAVNLEHVVLVYSGQRDRGDEGDLVVMDDGTVLIGNIGLLRLMQEAIVRGLQ